MKNAVTLAVAAIALLSVAAQTACAQKGAADPTNADKQAVKPEIVSLSGRIIEVKTGSCEFATGQELSGEQVILDTTEKQQLNIHLGPKEAVAAVIAKLSIGEQLAVKAFQTEKMKKKHYVAQSLALGKTVFKLRDADLRPVWSDIIAVTAADPSLKADVAPRFGHCPYIILMDRDGETFRALKNTNAGRGNAGMRTAEMIAKKGVTILLTGECGPSASKALDAAGVRVISGCSGTVVTAIRQFKAEHSPSTNKATIIIDAPSKKSPVVEPGR